jgi:hypothetical protein
VGMYVNVSKGARREFKVLAPLCLAL